MKKLLPILALALLMACHKDNPAPPASHAAQQSQQDPNLIGVWVQDSVLIIEQPPTAIDSGGPHNSIINDTLYVEYAAYLEICTQNPAYESYSFPSSIWQTPNSDSLFVTWVNGGKTEWVSHYKYIISNNHLFIQNSVMYQYGTIENRDSTVEYWYHRIH